ncbi:MAG: UDP-N-acetylmuramoyl-tripeptide--D-alanyl-D-alanine ligase [Parachlamydiales bacterium]|nr:UDP-N-acetylmuramoyl-tripeptide--D-alanyl-D-alanine ligase [Parachlamydiales bacterium]
MKEYRFDRFKVFLKSKSGRQQLDLLSIEIKLLGFLLLVLLPLTKFTYIAIFLFVFLFFLDIRFFYEYYKKKIRKPVFTLRGKEIFGISAVLILGYLIYLRTYTIDHFLIFLFAELLLIAAPFAGIILTQPLVDRAKKKEIKKAKERLAKVRPKVIGVTGSYGKTTTKDFIYQMISGKVRTSKTPGSHNTEFGLARAVVNGLKKNDEYFVAEYGAYTMGDIKKLKKIIEPDIAVLTAIEPQHLELFGSMKNLRKAKYELFEDLSKGGLAIFNVGSKGAKKLYRMAKRNLKDVKILTYSRDGKDKADIILQGYKKINDTYQINITIDSKDRIIRTNMKLPFLLENLLPAILIAREIGVDWKTIIKACSKLILPQKTMDIKKLSKNITVIDDSHNLNPTAFMASVQYLDNFKDHKKIVVTPGMIELGNISNKLHRKVAKKMKDVGVDTLILTRKDHFNVFKRILEKKVIKYNDMSVELFKENKNDKLVVLLAGRIPERVKNDLKGL